jgi:hypothetical protein
MVRKLTIALSLAGSAMPLVAAPLTARLGDAAGKPVRDVRLRAPPVMQMTDD